MMTEQVFSAIARGLSMRLKIEDEAHCSLYDAAKDLYMSIEFCGGASGMCIWTCQSVVGDISPDSHIMPQLLMLNNNGLLWCYHALRPYEEGGVERLSLNLKYSFATPADNGPFALRLLGTVMARMRESTLEITRELLA